ncbi:MULTISPECIES: SWIM zinc finger family protein [Prochlorococcus]|uniref:Uncharacterized SWIM-like Zn-finger-containing conserved protein n=1 Tax=Prochlorococcus marinus (strain SARG / CCMP1375 / SS120) TaxID=167539 RepID=Q7VEG7_PROMA|nr:MULTISPECIES: SWIM zinc finger family protein [Prochlorococcus]AAP99092.1 Uncharacterized SWIM-like Zn-finger-containing conserved protein [Prochlorococcus marinus subsp. marinus str. CCMP1375]KGG11650.1 hypothetical protein EV04_0937 [Prochlorococcus marinus str. LG]KGG22342.1 hypothetical protein EV08_0160 [Prochlorococcus marinus str. SS2]KGG22677.1 hypothetical protein EV09_1416 [Prochlorococcus marinus str. SS35]KGG32901.1 hypothetical protein EV10_0881 [Prochlorococcus marinus str. SS
MNNSEITRAIGRDGLGQQSWWVEQWMELINSYRYKKRLERAWIYAREGKVSSIIFEGQRVHARVQGTEIEPYKVKLWLDVLDDEDWKYVIEALAKKAKWSAQLLAGVMPKDIEQAFATSGKRLFPFNLQEVKSECSCPDQANPCKHISAIYFLMGDQFKEDPFILFQLRGRNKNRLLSDLSKERVITTKKNEEGKRKNILHKLPKKSNAENGSKKILNQWWSYRNNLDDDLVVIAPSIEEKSGEHLDRELPLATAPAFPDSQITFLNNLVSYHQQQRQKAMIQAMSINH